MRVLPKAEVTAIPLNFERYISFSIKVNDFEFRFLDSVRFLQNSLSNLVDITSDDNLKHTRQHFFGGKFGLMKRKGVFPYSYMDSFDKLNETQLPEKKEFYNDLTDCDITDEDYEHAKSVWNTFESIKTLGNYAENYLKSDILLLTDVMETFRDLSLRIYGLDPCYYYTIPGFSYDAMLKMTKIKLELLKDIDMLLYLEKGIQYFLYIIISLFLIFFSYMFCTYLFFRYTRGFESM